MTDDRSTHFGYQQVDVGEKARKVADVFHSVASRYDVMNDLMSGGAHRLWKRFAIEVAAVRPGQRVLDLATGTGDLAAKFARLVGPSGEVVASDINASMLGEGRRRLEDKGIAGNVEYVQASAEVLPFPSNHFDCVTIAFGLRNVTHKERALAEMHRVLRPGGRVMVLEFSHPTTPLVKPLYDAYSFNVIPKLGGMVTGDEASYRYLVESIRMHPDQAALGKMMEEAGFEQVDWYNLTFGVVALHRGFKA